MHTQLPAGWTHETMGPTTDGYWHDAHDLGVVRDRRDEPPRYAVVHAADGTPAARADGSPRSHPTLEAAIADAVRGA